MLVIKCSLASATSSDKQRHDIMGIFACPCMLADSAWCAKDSKTLVAEQNIASGSTFVEGVLTHSPTGWFYFLDPRGGLGLVSS